MSERATLPRPRTRAGANVQVTLADHVGAPAGDAARALRRAGFRPALDRQLGHPAQAAGLVVAQEPPGGGEQPRGSMVTLYVAAPDASDRREDRDESGQPPPPAERERGADTRASQTASGRATEPTRLQSPKVSYRSDPGAAATAFVLRSPVGEQDGTQHGLTGATQERPARAAATGRAPAAKQSAPPVAASEMPRAEDAVNELAAGMREAFSRPPGEGRRRRYPREPLALRALAALAWARRRHARVVICAVVIGWLASALGHRTEVAPRAPRPQAPSRDTARTKAIRLGANRAPRVQRRHAARRGRPPRTARHREHRRVPRGQGRVLIARETPPAPPSGPTAPASPPRPSPTPAQVPPTPAQSAGGPFSP